MSFIVIEGPDGVGKSVLTAAFGWCGWPTFKFPRSPRPAAGLDETEAMLDDMASAREELLAVGPAVVDRYDMSTLVYQGFLRGVDDPGQLNEKAAQYVLGRMRQSRRLIARPDLYVVLLGPRLRSADEATSAEDRQSVELQRAAYERAVELMWNELWGHRYILRRPPEPRDIKDIELWWRALAEQKEELR